MVLASQLDKPDAIALDAGSVYWSDGAQGTISRVSKSGGTEQIIVTGQTAPHSLAVAGDDLFWNDDDGLYRIAMCNIGAGRVQLASVSVGGLSVDGKRAVTTDTHHHQVIAFAR